MDPADSTNWASDAAAGATVTDQPLLQRFKAIIAYDGTLFHGWQKQTPLGREPLRTVAGVVESAMALALQQPINLVGASRTDAGVHALGQVAQFDAATRIPIERLADAVNSRLPEDVEVRSIEPAPADFDAIGQARSKQYRYRIFNSPQRPLTKRHHVWHCWWTLDLDRMNDAAARLVGTHDFAAYTAANHGRLTTVRTIHHCAVERAEEPELHIVVRGDGFLYNMVRIIAGTLAEIGRGRLNPSTIDRTLSTGNRRDAGPTLPPTGLWLEWVKYDEGV